MQQLLLFTIKVLILTARQPRLMAEPLRGPNIEAVNIPFFASLARKHADFALDRDHFCSGSLIAPHLVLTAAHCLDGETYEHVDVVIGAADLRGAEPKYKVHSWITFDGWAARREPGLRSLDVKDLAVIKLKDKVSGVKAADMTTLRTAQLHGRNATMTGWADVENGMTRFMRKAEVRILTAAECEQRFQAIIDVPGIIPAGVLCTAGSSFTFGTSGDSGAPLVDEDMNILGVQMGICPKSTYNCSQEVAHRYGFNMHVDFIDEYRRFIDEMKTATKQNNKISTIC